MQPLVKEDERIVTRAIENRDAGRKWRKDEFEERALRNWRYFVGDQWHGKVLPAWKAKICINHCSKIVRHQLPLLTDARPQMAIHAREPNDLAAAEIADALFRFKWQQLHMDLKRSIAYFYALIFGIGWFKPRIDPYERDGLGDLAVDVPDPWHVMIDPNVSWSMYPYEAIERAEFVVYEFPMSVRKLKNRLRALADNPEVARKAGLVDGAVEHVESLSGGSKSERSPWAREQVLLTEAGVAIRTVPLLDTTGSNTVYAGKKSSGPEETEEVMLSEVWLKDDDYPNGLLVTLCDDYALQIRPNPLKHKRFPFIPIVCNPLPGRLIGFGVIDDIIPIQDELNKRRSQIMDILNMYKGPPVIAEAGAIDLDNFSWSPGAVIEIEPGKNVRIGENAQIPHDLWNSAQSCEQDIEKISGIGEMLTGRELKAGTPGVAVEEVAEAQLQRIRMIERLNNASFVELGQQSWAIMQQLYGPQAGAEGTGYVIRVVGTVPGPDGTPKQSMIPQVFKADDIAGEFDFEWIPNSAYSLRRQVWFKQLTDLKALGAPIRWDMILDTTDLPDKEGLKKAIKDEEMKQEQMAQQQAAMGMPPQGGG